MPEPHRVQLARRVLDRLRVRPGAAHPCPYLPTEQARDIAFQVNRLPAGLYHGLMDLNFRRSGRIIYRPTCERCDQCRAVRVPVRRVRLDRAQRRCLARNRDLSVGVIPPVATPEKHELYRRYLHARHNRQMDDTWEAFRGFLYVSPVDSLELVYRRAGRLVGSGLIDIDGDAVSAVYCYFDPDDRGSLGTFNILFTIDYARWIGATWLYLGYYIRDCANMNYKRRFQPCELLDRDGRWIEAKGEPGDRP